MKKIFIHFNILPVGFKRIIIVVMVITFFIGLSTSANTNFVDILFGGLFAVLFYWLVVLAFCWIYAGFKINKDNK